MSLTRRQFGQDTLASLVTYSLLDLLLAKGAFGGEMKALAAKWIKDLNELSQDVKGKKFSQVEWQQKVDSLFEHIDLTDALKFLDFDKIPLPTSRNPMLTAILGEAGIRSSNVCK